MKIPMKKKRKQQKKVTDSKYNFTKFNIFSTLFSSVKLTLYNCSHKHPMRKLIYKPTFSTALIPIDCVVI